MIVPYDLCSEGGVKRHAENLAAALRQSGDEVDIWGPCSDAQVLKPGMYGFSGILSLRAHGSAARIGAFVSPRSVYRLLRARRYDVLHVHEPLIPMLNDWALFFRRQAAVCTFHSFNEHEGGFSRYLRGVAYRILHPFLDRGIAVSPLAEGFIGDLFRRPLRVIPNGVPTDIFRPLQPPSSDETTPLRLLFVGNWNSARKGLPILLQAFEQLRARGLALTLDIIGDGGQAQPRTLPGVTYHGPIAAQEELCRHYSRCDIFVAPSTGQESFGIVLLEAMACERPVICSDIDAFRAVATDGTKPHGALLVPPNDVDAIAQAISELMADPDRRRQMGLRNRHRALSFDWGEIARLVRKEYVTALRVREQKGFAVPPPAATLRPAD
jgi:phosphatidylinositol alpha-mannosyltransferase